MPTKSDHVQGGWWFLCALLSAPPVLAADMTAPEVRDHAEQAFQLLHKRELRVMEESHDHPAKEQVMSNDVPHVLTGHGQGDLSKGKLVCQRVSELAARADIAKQIRVLVKEHATDRLRERTGREAEQDIEVVREEIVQEYLQGVKIIDRHSDEDSKTCSATAVMPRDQLPSSMSHGSPAADSAAHR